MRLQYLFNIILKGFHFVIKISDDFIFIDNTYQLIIQGLIVNDRKMQLWILFASSRMTLKKLTGDIGVGQQGINGISFGGISNSFDNTFVPHKARNGC